MKFGDRRLGEQGDVAENVMEDVGRLQIIERSAERMKLPAGKRRLLK
jgi:hypothetical protein